MKKKMLCSLVCLSISVTSLTEPAAALQSFMGSDFSCETAEADLAREMEGSQPPSSAGTITLLQHLMWMLQQGLNLLDSSCRGEAGYAQTRASWQNSYDQSLRTCQQIASSSSYCYPKRYY